MRSRRGRGRGGRLPLLVALIAAAAAVWLLAARPCHAFVASPAARLAPTRARHARSRSRSSLSPVSAAAAGGGEAPVPLSPPSPLPEHLAIVLDGNGRWAERRGLPRGAGHREGAKRAFEILDACRTMGGIKVCVCVYACVHMCVHGWMMPAGCFGEPRYGHVCTWMDGPLHPSSHCARRSCLSVPSVIPMTRPSDLPTVKHADRHDVLPLH